MDHRVLLIVTGNGAPDGPPVTRKRRELAPNFQTCSMWHPETPFLNMARSTAKDLDYSHMPDVHAAYREYVSFQWKHLDKRPCVWTRRISPSFYAGT